MRTFHLLNGQAFDFIVWINFFNVLWDVKFNTFDDKILFLCVQFWDFICKNWCFWHNMGLIYWEMIDWKILVRWFHKWLALNNPLNFCLRSKGFWRSAYFSRIKINFRNISTIVDWNSLWAQVFKFLEKLFDFLQSF